MKPIAVEHHFPWYADPTDTTNIDCQCGHPCDGIGGWADHITKELAMPTGPLQTFSEVWSSRYLANDLGVKLRCEEVEALAGMLRTLGAASAAADWIDAHAPGDECDDMHCLCDDCDKDQ